jgi:hypothetical protein
MVAPVTTSISRRKPPPYEQMYRCPFGPMRMSDGSVIEQTMRTKAPVVPSYSRMSLVAMSPI